MTYPDQNRIFKVLEKLKTKKIRPTEVIGESASPMDRMKFNICQCILVFKREHNYTNLELAEILGVVASSGK